MVLKNQHTHRLYHEIIGLILSDVDFLLPVYTNMVRFSGRDYYGSSETLQLHLRLRKMFKTYNHVCIVYSKNVERFHIYVGIICDMQWFVSAIFFSS